LQFSNHLPLSFAEELVEQHAAFDFALLARSFSDKKSNGFIMKLLKTFHIHTSWIITSRISLTCNNFTDNNLFAVPVWIQLSDKSFVLKRERRLKSPRLLF